MDFSRIALLLGNLKNLIKIQATFFKCRYFTHDLFIGRLFNQSEKKTACRFAKADVFCWKITCFYVPERVLNVYYKRGIFSFLQMNVLQDLIITNL